MHNIRFAVDIVVSVADMVAFVVDIVVDMVAYMAHLSLSLCHTGLWLPS